MAKRVLVVDDSPTIRKIVQVCLNGAGLEFEGASGGDEALASISERAPALVLADVSGPSPDGYELCARIKKGKLGKSVRVVLMADPFQPFDSDKARAAKADGNISKPFDAGTLMAMIGDQLGSEFKVRSAGERGSKDAALLEEEAQSGRPLPAGLDASRPGMSPAELDAVARRVVRILSERVVRDIAWEVVPELSELLIKERLQKR